MKNASEKLFIIFSLAGLLGSPLALAHHGVAALGAIGLEGPGAPVETSTSATLPVNEWLLYLKLDEARFKTFTPEIDDETSFNRFTMLGLGYGLKSWLSLYAFLPYNFKSSENGAFDTQGVADASINAVVGFKYDQGFKLIPEIESLDDLEDWHFTVYVGSTLPNGNANLRDPNGDIDPGKSLGFGSPALSLGLTTTKLLATDLTAIGEVSALYFTPYRHTDQMKRQFGSEERLNGALCYRAWTDTESQSRVDANLEANFLSLGRDRVADSGELATGGKILYLVPGFRSYYKSYSGGVGLKIPVWSQLNEAPDQQGAEGKENYRLIVSFSALY